MVNMNKNVVFVIEKKIIIDSEKIMWYISFVT